MKGGADVVHFLTAVLLACYFASTQGQGVHCSESVKLENPPNAARCRKLIQFFGTRPDCTQALHKRCCSASDAFFTSNCACADGATDSMLETVDNLHSDCLQEEGGSTVLKGATGLLKEAAQAIRIRAGGTNSRRKSIPAKGGAAAHPAPEDLRVFVGVLSYSQHLDRREAIRATWATDPRLHRVLFFVSRPISEANFTALRQEAHEHGDVVVLGHVLESYHNITYQTFEMCRAVALDSDATHLLKVDDDTFVRVDRLLDELASQPRAHMFMGFMEWNTSPHRDPTNQWFVSKEDWEEDRFDTLACSPADSIANVLARYPVWAHGTGYLLSADLAKEVATGVPYALRPNGLFKLEDVSMGSWVEHVAKEQQLHVEYVHSSRFNFWGCSLSDILSHYVSPKKQRCMFKRKGKCCRG